MITFTFTADESGDPSLNFRKGASRYFVISVVGTQFPDSLRDYLGNIRKNLRLANHYEFGFHKLASVKLREKIFTALSGADFEAWALYSG